jgi:hypothetical protein
MFYRNVGAFNHYMVQNPKRIAALCDDVSCWLDIHEIARAYWSILVFLLADLSSNGLRVSPPPPQTV